MRIGAESRRSPGEVLFGATTAERGYPSSPRPGRRTCIAPGHGVIRALHALPKRCAGISGRRNAARWRIGYERALGGSPSCRLGSGPIAPTFHVKQRSASSRWRCRPVGRIVGQGTHSRPMCRLHRSDGRCHGLVAVVDPPRPRPTCGPRESGRHREEGGPSSVASRLIPRRARRFPVTTMRQNEAIPRWEPTKARLEHAASHDCRARFAGAALSVRLHSRCGRHADAAQATETGIPARDTRAQPRTNATAA
jgi:hypothetical protein